MIYRMVRGRGARIVSPILSYFIKFSFNTLGCILLYIPMFSPGLYILVIIFFFFFFFFLSHLYIYLLGGFCDCFTYLIKKNLSSIEEYLL